jgi:hypothetical protein
VKTRRGLAAALVVSLAAHAAAGWALARLQSGAAGARRHEAELAPVVHLLLPARVRPAGKLAPDDSPMAQATDTLAPKAVPVAVVVAAPGGKELGPAIPDGPPGGVGANATPGEAGIASGSKAPDGATTTFFGVPARGQNIVYLVDHSCSMGMQGALDTARREVLASLRQLPVEARFQVVLYNSSAEPLVGRADELLPATPANLDRAAKALQDVEAEGDTRHLRGFQLALNLHPDVLFFLTDGDDLTAQEEYEILRLNGGRALIHTIELTPANRGRTEMPMQRLARATGGCYRGVDLFAP